MPRDALAAPCDLPCDKAIALKRIVCREMNANYSKLSLGLVVSVVSVLLFALASFNRDEGQALAWSFEQDVERLEQKIALPAKQQALRLIHLQPGANSRHFEAVSKEIQAISASGGDWLLSYWLRPASRRLWMVMYGHINGECVGLYWANDKVSKKTCRNDLKLGLSPKLAMEKSGWAFDSASMVVTQHKAGRIESFLIARAGFGLHEILSYKSSDLVAALQELAWDY